MTLETTDMQSLSRIARKNILDKLEKTLNGPQDPFKVSETMGVLSLIHISEPTRPY